MRFYWCENAQHTPWWNLPLYCVLANRNFPGEAYLRPVFEFLMNYIEFLYAAEFYRDIFSFRVFVFRIPRFSEFYSLFMCLSGRISTN